MSTTRTPRTPGSQESVQPPTPPGRASAVAAGPRWARPLLVRGLLMVVVLMTTYLLLQAVTVVVGDTGGGTRPLVALVVGLVSAGLGLVVYAGLVRWLEGRRTIDELSPGDAAGGLTRGVLTGLLLFSAVVAVLAALGSYRVTGTRPITALAASAGFMVLAGTLEELVFRGVVFRLLEPRLGTPATLALSAVLFGAVHLGAPDATVWGAIAVALEGGLLLGAAYVATRSLWVPIGLHIGWNFAQNQYGAVVSGATSYVPPGVLTSTTHGPTALTGGGFGPEASLPALVVCACATAVLLLHAARRGHLRRADLRGRRVAE